MQIDSDDHIFMCFTCWTSSSKALLFRLDQLDLSDQLWSRQTRTMTRSVKTMLSGWRNQDWNRLCREHRRRWAITFLKFFNVVFRIDWQRTSRKEIHSSLPIPFHSLRMIFPNQRQSKMQNFELVTIPIQLDTIAIARDLHFASAVDWGIDLDRDCSKTLHRARVESVEYFSFSLTCSRRKISDGGWSGTARLKTKDRWRGNWQHTLPCERVGDGLFSDNSSHNESIEPRRKKRISPEWFREHHEMHRCELFHSSKRWSREKEEVHFQLPKSFLRRSSKESKRSIEHWNPFQRSDLLFTPSLTAVNTEWTFIDTDQSIALFLRLAFVFSIPGSSIPFAR